jgi:hypothetical protein
MTGDGNIFTNDFVLNRLEAMGAEEKLEASKNWRGGKTLPGKSAGSSLREERPSKTRVLTPAPGDKPRSGTFKQENGFDLPSNESYILRR